ncbi:hypothetical protein CEUSTIGMA_g3270.t1 [Chlamydomonas eustigma]|uniref:Uncharacterized protein n=1 Tax=Chlamydomonas eustigma TaxID=1157962 RepID=A0A250WYA7_9CHLO|nr:hypothetical protein CEUSTIGMA_g3270.t1 [Chlamydomonas eustigma]|eukprot:GAX75827.1 hypothetical protein CEUSTIGMA_g3270.t1 [Chlamydomonas eustigma]
MTSLSFRLADGEDHARMDMIYKDNAQWMGTSGPCLQAEQMLHLLRGTTLCLQIYLMQTVQSFRFLNQRWSKGLSKLPAEMLTLLRFIGSRPVLSYLLNNPARVPEPRLDGTEDTWRHQFHTTAKHLHNLCHKFLGLRGSSLLQSPEDDIFLSCQGLAADFLLHLHNGMSRDAGLYSLNSKALPIHLPSLMVALHNIPILTSAPLSTRSNTYLSIIRILSGAVRKLVTGVQKGHMSPPQLQRHASLRESHQGERHSVTATSPARQQLRLLHTLVRQASRVALDLTEACKQVSREASGPTFQVQQAVLTLLFAAITVCKRSVSSASNFGFRATAAAAAAEANGSTASLDTSVHSVEEGDPIPPRANNTRYEKGSHLEDISSQSSAAATDCAPRTSHVHSLPVLEPLQVPPLPPSPATPQVQVLLLVSMHLLPHLCSSTCAAMLQSLHAITTAAKKLLLPVNQAGSKTRETLGKVALVTACQGLTQVASNMLSSLLLMCQAASTHLPASDPAMLMQRSSPDADGRPGHNCFGYAMETPSPPAGSALASGEVPLPLPLLLLMVMVMTNAGVAGTLKMLVSTTKRLIELDLGVSLDDVDNLTLFDCIKETCQKAAYTLITPLLVTVDALVQLAAGASKEVTCSMDDISMEPTRNDLRSSGASHAAQSSGASYAAASGCAPPRSRDEVSDALVLCCSWCASILRSGALQTAGMAAGLAVELREQQLGGDAMRCHELREQQLGGDAMRYHELREQQLGGDAMRCHELREQQLGGDAMRYHELREQQLGGDAMRCHELREQQLGGDAMRCHELREQQLGGDAMRCHELREQQLGGDAMRCHENPIPYSQACTRILCSVVTCLTALRNSASRSKRSGGVGGGDDTAAALRDRLLVEVEDNAFQVAIEAARFAAAAAAAAGQEDVSRHLGNPGFQNLSNMDHGLSPAVGSLTKKAGLYIIEDLGEKDKKLLNIRLHQATRRRPGTREEAKGAASVLAALSSGQHGRQQQQQQQHAASMLNSCHSNSAASADHEDMAVGGTEEATRVAVDSSQCNVHLQLTTVAERLVSLAGHLADASKLLMQLSSCSNVPSYPTAENEGLTTLIADDRHDTSDRMSMDTSAPGGRPSSAPGGRPTSSLSSPIVLQDELHPTCASSALCDHEDLSNEGCSEQKAGVPLPQQAAASCPSVAAVHQDDNPLFPVSGSSSSSSSPQAVLTAVSASSELLCHQDTSTASCNYVHNLQTLCSNWGLLHSHVTTLMHIPGEHCCSQRCSQGVSPPGLASTAKAAEVGIPLQPVDRQQQQEHMLVAEGNDMSGSGGGVQCIEGCGAWYCCHACQDRERIEHQKACHRRGGGVQQQHVGSTTAIQQQQASSSAAAAMSCNNASAEAAGSRVTVVLAEGSSVNALYNME